MARPASSAKAFLVDGTAFCYRAFYAIRGLSTSDGRPTNAVYGFAVMLQALREKERPDYLGVAFDVGKPTFRHRQFEDYKVQRKPMPDPLIAQLPLVKRLLAAYRIPIYECAGYEAEDVLATIATRIASEDVEVFLVTGDKDVLQLVNSHIKVYNPHKDNQEAVLDAASVRARYGVEPERMVDLMALMGDEIDNIPGVPGIGEKTAVQLLQRFGSLEQLYDHLDDVDSPARRHALASLRDQVELARRLARIDCQVPCEVAREDLKVQEPDWRALRAIFRELEFTRLLRAVEARAPMAPTPTTHAHLVDRESDLAALLKRLAGAPAIALGCWPAQAGAASSGGMVLAMAREADTAWVLWVDAARLGTAQGRRFREWLANPATHKLCHDAKTTKRLLGRLGVVVEGIVGDTMLAAHLLNPARTNQTLSDLSDEALEMPLCPLPTVEGLLDLAPTAIAPFAQAACTILQLHARFLPSLQTQGLESLYTELELPLVDVLVAMETVGIALDVSWLERLRASMAATLTQLTQELYQLAGGTFNLNSPKQLAGVLFEQLRLPVVKRTKTGPSTDSDVLRQLAKHHPFPERLIAYRELSKLVSTYVEALPKLVDPSTGRLHASFHQTATATGRLSASDPNLQHIPIKTELGRQIRKAFIPGERGWRLVAADYSQIELRVLAHLSNDPQLIEAFRQDRDIHRYTASLIYGLPEADVTPEMRSATKAINFGILYGMSAHGLAKELGLSYEDAATFINAYFERYPKVRAFLDAQVAQAAREGYVQTLLGRRRYIPELQSPDPVVRQVGERMAVNAPIQGTAADLIKRAMVRVAAKLRERQLASRLLLQVHDELVFECPAREQDALASLVREVMEHAAALIVPLRVVVKHGSNWLEMTPVQ